MRARSALLLLFSLPIVAYLIGTHPGLIDAQTLPRRGSLSGSVPAGSVTGLGTIGTQDADSVDIDGGAIDGTTIGGTSPAPASLDYVHLKGTTVNQQVMLEPELDSPTPTGEDAVIGKTSGQGAAPFDQAGSLVFVSRESNTAGRSSHLFYTGDPATLRFKVDEVGNVIAGDVASPSGGGTPVLVLPNAGSDPTGVASNTAGLVNKSGELYAFDDGGNVTLLSPHNEAGEIQITSRNTRTARRVTLRLEAFIRHYDEIHGTAFHVESKPLN